MTKLIDGIAFADRLLADAITTEQRRVANLIMQEINAMPEAVVRCKDCALSQPRVSKCGSEFLRCTYTNRSMTDDEFCSHGRERAE